MKTSDLEAQLAVIAKAAPELRKAGVITMKLGDLELALTAAEINPANADTTTPDNHVDPLSDPATYGGYMPRPRGARPPDGDGMTDDDDR